MKGRSIRPPGALRMGMNGDGMTDYYELAELADRIFAISDDNIELLMKVLETLDSNILDELLFSDFLNAYQVFFYYFRENPTEIGHERLILQPASSVLTGIRVEEQGFVWLVFRTIEKVPTIEIWDGDFLVRSFNGVTAYREALSFADSYE
jgi:hypothetical protein